MNPVTPPSAGVSPVLVATLRAIVYAVVIAGLAVLVAAVGDLDAADLGEYGWALPFLVALGRVLEGVLDKLRGQAPQKSIAGSAPANPAAYLP